MNVDWNMFFMFLALLEVDSVVTFTGYVLERDLCPPFTEPAVLSSLDYLLRVALLQELLLVPTIRLGPGHVERGEKLRLCRNRSDETLSIHFCLVALNVDTKDCMVLAKAFPNDLHLAPTEVVVADVNVDESLVRAEAGRPSLGEEMPLLLLLSLLEGSESAADGVERDVKDLERRVELQVLGNHTGAFTHDFVVVQEQRLEALAVVDQLADIVA